MNKAIDNCSASKLLQFTGTKGGHRLALETRSDGLPKLRLAGRGKESRCFPAADPGFVPQGDRCAGFIPLELLLGISLAYRPDVFTMTSWRDDGVPAVKGTADGWFGWCGW